MKNLLFSIILFFIWGCIKERNNLNDLLIGSYSKGFDGQDCLVIDNENIKNSSFEVHIGSQPLKVKILYNNELIIPNQTYTGIDCHFGCVEIVDSYEGKGFYDAELGTITFNYSYSHHVSSGYSSNGKGIIQYFKISDSAFSSTYIGDSTTVVINNYNDSLRLSILYQPNLNDEPWGWINLKGIKLNCSIQIRDSLAEISSGEIFDLRGGGFVCQDQIKFYFQLRNQTAKTLSFWDFNVKRVSVKLDSFNN